MFNCGQLEIHNDRYNLPKVNELYKQLGPYNFGLAPPPGQQDEHEKRPLILLESGAKYEGEWLFGTNVRDGRGV